MNGLTGFISRFDQTTLSVMVDNILANIKFSFGTYLTPFIHFVRLSFVTQVP